MNTENPMEVLLNVDPTLCTQLPSRANSLVA